MPSFRASRSARELPRVPVPTARAIVDCGVYVQGRRLPGRFTHRDACAEVRNRGEGFVWVGLHDPDDRQMGDIAETFGLHALVVEDAVKARQRPKLERYDDTLVLVMRTVSYVEHELHSVSEIVESGEIMVFCAPDFVVTVRHGEHSGLASVRKQLEADPAMLMYGPGAVLHAVADYVVDTYIEVAASVELDIDAMEEEVFTPRSQVAVESIYQLKREVVELRRAVTPLAIPLQLLGHKPDLPLPKEIRRYLRDVADHHTGVAERIADFDGSLSALISAALAKIGVQQNTDMRKISAYVAIAAVPTMGAGIYGMNFEHMPELRWTYGYPLVLSVIAVACVALFVTFRRNHWL
ncbi:magnesium and cobalt transport protein CorA [Nocardia sp. NEAU-351]|uniref:Magnesium and cobalt transport protein CorA n=2 Tax=Nocardia bovistercoris TaxID=2785916 RepID=A0A931I7U1_9NOCA|nr:magnesium and cobalt transport protein CorA [Nocardia bovistercoris]MBH0775871.1 magnesium and cobalt transport protein CorA [Nocardia bovistercoris]